MTRGSTTSYLDKKRQAEQLEQSKKIKIGQKKAQKKLVRPRLISKQIVV